MSILLEIVPASIIYDTNNVHVTTREIYSQLADYRKLTQDTTRHYTDRVQAWQFVKAYTQIIKDRKEMRKQSGGNK